MPRICPSSVRIVPSPRRVVESWFDAFRGMTTWSGEHRVPRPRKVLNKRSLRIDRWESREYEYNSQATDGLAVVGEVAMSRRQSQSRRSQWRLQQQRLKEESRS